MTKIPGTKARSPGFRRCLPGAATLMMLPSMAHAWTIQIAWWEFYLLGLVLGLSGMLLSGVLFYRATGWSRAFLLLLLVWVLVMPWAALLGMSAVTPGILGQLHAWSAWQIFLRVWLLGGLIPLLPAWALSHFLRTR